MIREQVSTEVLNTYSHEMNLSVMSDFFSELSLSLFICTTSMLTSVDRFGTQERLFLLLLIK